MPTDNTQLSTDELELRLHSLASLQTWREILMKKGFSAPVAETCMYTWDKYTPKIWWGERFYIFSYGSFQILLKATDIEQKQYPHIVVRKIGPYDIPPIGPCQQDLAVAKIPSVTRQTLEETIRLADAIADSTGIKILLCMNIKWAKNLVETILKEEICPAM